MFWTHKNGIDEGTGGNVYYRIKIKGNSSLNNQHCQAICSRSGIGAPFLWIVVGRVLEAISFKDFFNPPTLDRFGVAVSKQQTPITRVHLGLVHARKTMVLSVGL